MVVNFRRGCYASSVQKADLVPIPSPFPPNPAAWTMRVLGHGIDLVEIERFQASDDADAIRRFERHFLRRELAAAGDGPHRAGRLAARFAAKEAILKAIGTGWGDGIAFTDIEVVTTPRGAPTVAVYGGAAAIANKLGITTWLVTLTHTAAIAAASVIAIGE